MLLDMPTVAEGRLTVRLEDTDGQIVASAEPLALAGAPPPEPGAIFGIGQMPAVVPVLAGFAGLVAVAAVLASLRRKEQPSL